MPEHRQVHFEFAELGLQLQAFGAQRLQVHLFLLSLDLYVVAYIEVELHLRYFPERHQP